MRKYNSTSAVTSPDKLSLVVSRPQFQIRSAKKNFTYSYGEQVPPQRLVSVPKRKPSIENQLNIKMTQSAVSIPFLNTSTNLRKITYARKLPKLRSNNSITSTSSSRSSSSTKEPIRQIKKTQTIINQIQRLNSVKEEGSETASPQAVTTQKIRPPLKKTNFHQAAQQLLKNIDQDQKDASPSSQSSDQSEEHNIWNDEELNAVGIFPDKMIEDQTNIQQFLSLYKLRYESYPNQLKRISNSYIWYITEAIAKRTGNKWLSALYSDGLGFDNSQDYCEIMRRSNIPETKLLDEKIITDL